jgi:hypothetical protein
MLIFNTFHNIRVLHKHPHYVITAHCREVQNIEGKMIGETVYM